MASFFSLKDAKLEKLALKCTKQLSRTFYSLWELCAEFSFISTAFPFYSLFIQLFKCMSKSRLKTCVMHLVLFHICSACKHLLTYLSRFSFGLFLLVSAHFSVLLNPLDLPWNSHFLRTVTDRSLSLLWLWADGGRRIPERPVFGWIQTRRRLPCLSRGSGASTSISRWRASTQLSHTFHFRVYELTCMQEWTRARGELQSENTHGCWCVSLFHLNWCHTVLSLRYYIKAFDTLPGNIELLFSWHWHGLK